MNKKPFSVLLNLIMYPLISLGLVYGSLFLLDQDISRATFTLIVVVSLLLPVVVLAYGLQQVFAMQTPSRTPLAAGISALFWVAVAAVANQLIPSDQAYTFDQSLVSFVFYLISVTIILYLIMLMKVIMTQKKKQS